MIRLRRFSRLPLTRAALAAASLAAAPWAAGAPPGQSEVIARISGIDVSSEEMRAYLETLPAQEKAALAKEPASLAQLVRAYLARRALLKEAQAKKWDQQPAVRAQLERAREQALIELYLESISRPPEGYPSDAELQAAYEANKSAFQLPRQFHLAQIYVSAGKDKGGESQARRKVDELSRRLKQKASDFAAVARAESEEKASAPQGGDIGWLSEEQLVPGIRTAVTGLSKDAISEPVRLEDGWHFIKLLEVRPASIRPLAEVRDSLAAQLRAERARNNRQAYLSKLLEQNPPTINELALPKVLASATSKTAAQ